jgi:hypothetical protein
MKQYTFNYAIRSDDYHPVFNRQNNFDKTIQEILHLDDSVSLGFTSSEITEEGTGNLCTFTSRLFAEERPNDLFNSATNYVKLRDIDFEVTLEEYVEPEPVIEETIIVEPEVVKPEIVTPKAEEELPEEETEE